jgi:hypothetical protein
LKTIELILRWNVIIFRHNQCSSQGSTLNTNNISPFSIVNAITLERFDNESTKYIEVLSKLNATNEKMAVGHIDLHKSPSAKLSSK